MLRPYIYLVSSLWSYPQYTNGTIAYDPTKKILLTYDSTQVVQQKVNYVNQQKLAGMLMWDTSGDLPPSSNGSLLPIIAHGMQTN